MDSLKFILLVQNLKDTNFCVSDLFILVKRWVNKKGYDFKGILDITENGICYSIYKADLENRYHLQGRDYVSFDELFNFIQEEYND